MSGYSDIDNGSLTAQSMAGFFSRSRSAMDDIAARATLVNRARILNLESPISRSILDCLTRGVVGSGFRLSLGEGLEGLSTEFEIASKRHEFDHTGRLTFNQLMQQVFYNMLLNGEIWALRTQDHSWLLKDPDYVKTPSYLPRDGSGNVMSGDNIVLDGIEVTKDSRPVAAWFKIDLSKPDADENFTRVPYVDDDERVCLLQIAMPERVGQYRGIPFISPVIAHIWSTLAYTDSELQMAILQANQSMIITSGTDPTRNPFEAITQRQLDAPIIPNSSQDTAPTPASPDISVFDYADSFFGGALAKTNFLRAGCSTHLAKGEDIKFLSPTAPSAGLKQFLEIQYEQIGSALGIPVQVLTGKFDANFSAVKGAVSSFNHTVNRFRVSFIETCLRPMFRAYLETRYTAEEADAIAMSASFLPNDSPLILDPTKEVDYYLKAVNAGLITRDEAAQLMFGHDAAGMPEQPTETTAWLTTTPR